MLILMLMEIMFLKYGVVILTYMTQINPEVQTFMSMGIAEIL